jgi:hypothetical protein
MFKKFVYAVNDIPFAGKLTIRPLAYHYWNARTTPEKSSWFIGLVFVLALFIFGHGTQSVLGFGNFSHHHSFLLNIIFLVYGLVNLAVSIAQTHLLFRAIKHLFKRLPKTKRKYVGMGCWPTVLCVLVTLLGQITFFVAYSISQSQ